MIRNSCSRVSSNQEVKMYRHLRLPPYLQVRKNNGAGPRTMRLIAKEPIERGTRLFSREIYSAGISGKSVSDIRSVCHNCLAPVGNTLPVVCRDCRIVSYCSTECLQVARTLHAIECKGVVELEKLRGKVALEIPKEATWQVDYDQYWPPTHVLLAARVINKGLMNKAQEASDWINFVTFPEFAEPIKGKVFAQMVEYIQMLVPDHISDREISRSLIAVCAHATTVEDTPINSSVIALYNVEYYLLNHMCKPNCYIDKVDKSFAVYTLEDIEAGHALVISLVEPSYYMNVREVRRPRIMRCYGFDCYCYVCREEMVPGTRLWLLEKRKSSLIAPWSFQMARHTMMHAWGVLIKCGNMKNSPSKCIQILEPCLAMLKLILDPFNVQYVLTASRLLLCYCQVKEYAKAVVIFYKSLGRKGLASLTEYGTRRDVIEITGKTCFCLFELQMMEKFHALFQLTQQFHPRHPSIEALCEELQLDDDSQSLTEEGFQIDDKLRQMLHVSADRLCIPHELYEEVAREYLSQYERRPTLPEMLEACGDIL